MQVNASDVLTNVPANTGVTVRLPSTLWDCALNVRLFNAATNTFNVWGGTPLGQATWGVMNEQPGPDYTAVIQTLLKAGARLEEADFPTGNPDVDDALRRHGARGT
jgi:hypothetical protein